MKFSVLTFARNNKSSSISIRSNHQKPAFGTFALATVAILMASFYGFLINIFPAEFIVGSLGLVALTLGVHFFPTTTLGVYTILILLIADFKIADALTIYMLVLFGLKSWRAFEASGKKNNTWIAFILYIGWCGMELMYGYIQHHAIPNIYGDFRSIVIYWLWAPLLLDLQEKKAFANNAVERIITITAVVVSTIAIAQALSGLQIIAGRTAELDTTPGVTRVQFNGFTFCVAAIALATAKSLNGKLSVPAAIALIAINLAGVYVNYGRALWIWTFFAVILCFILVGLKKSWKAIIILASTATIAVSALAIYKPQILDVLEERLASISNEGSDRTSYGWRKLENQAATKKIQESPVFGIGIGGLYRNWVSEISNFADHVRYIHNNYFFLATKIGIPGLLLLLLSILSRCAAVMTIKGGPRRSSPINLTLICVTAATLGLSITQPELTTPISTILLSLLLMAKIGPDSVAPRSTPHAA